MIKALVIATLLVVQTGWAQTTVTDTVSTDATDTTAAEATTETSNTSEAPSETTQADATDSDPIAVDNEYAYETFSDAELSAELDELLQEEEKSIIEFDVSGYYRVRGTIVNEPDTYADEYPKNLAFMQHRLWISPEMRLRVKPAVKLKADILFGENTQPCQDPTLRKVYVMPCTGLWGANGENILATNTADQIANITVARVWGEARLPFGQIRIGRMPSHWGLGLFSNDGQHEQWFGDNHLADTYDRIAFATKPMGEDSNLVVALAGDKIVEGSPTLSVSGAGNNDDVLEGIGVIYYNTDPLKIGFYQVFRKQSLTRSQIHISDIYAYIDIGLLYGGFEMLWLYGNTQGVPTVNLDTPSNAGNISVQYNDSKLNVWAWAMELGLRGAHYDGMLRMGNVTGDQNGPNDGTVSSFTLNPNHRVGLLMFDYANAILAERTLQASLDTVKVLIDDGRGTQAQLDELLAVADLNRTRGGVRNAFYINPVVKFEPNESLRLKGGFVWAQANHDVFLLGSPSPGGPTGRNYGYEFDAGASYMIGSVFELGFEAGYLIAGDIFDRPKTAIDPDSGLAVPLGGSANKASNASIATLNATWNFDTH